MSKFTSLLKLATLDEVTSRLVGKVPNDMIVKSLESNITESNYTLYNRLIQKAEEEEEDITALLRPEQRKLGEGKQKEVKEEEKETLSPSTTFDYYPFVRRYNELDDFSDSLLILNEIVKDLQVKKVEKSDETPSGYSIESNQIDRIGGEKESNTILNALRRFDNNPDFLVSNSEFSPYIKMVKGEPVFVALQPPKRLDKETQTMVDRSRKPDMEVQPIIDNALDLLKKTFPIEDGNGNMTLLDALTNLHINSYKKTPAGTAGRKKKFSKAILNLRKKLLGLDLGKEEKRIERQLKKLIKVGKSFDEAIKNRDACTDKIDELTQYLQASSDDIIAREISRTVKQISQYMSNKNIDKDKLVELQGILQDMRSAAGQKKGAIVRRVKTRLKFIIDLQKDKLVDLNNEIIDVGRYSDEVGDVISYTNRFLELTKVTDEEIDAIRERFLEQSDNEASRSKLEILDKKINAMVKSKKAYDALEKSLGIAISTLLGIEKEVKSINRVLKRLRSVSNSELNDYLDSLLVPLTKKTTMNEEGIKEKKVAIDTKKVVGVTDDDLEDAMNATYIITKDLDKVETKLKTVEEDFRKYEFGRYGSKEFADKKIAEIESAEADIEAERLAEKLRRRADDFKAGKEVATIQEIEGSYPEIKTDSSNKVGEEE
mgnify:CR=1 FL=1